jgi:Flp pilus assembly protein TadD
LLVPLGAVATYKQVGFWDNNETFWRHTLDVTPTSKPAALNLAYTLYLDQRFGEAEAVYLKELSYHPDDEELIQSLAAMRDGHPASSSQFLHLGH